MTDNVKDNFMWLNIGVSKLSVNLFLYFYWCQYYVEMFYLNTIEQLFLFVEQLDQLEVCVPFSRLLTGIPILAVFQNLRWDSNKTSLYRSDMNFKNNYIIQLHNIILVCTLCLVLIILNKIGHSSRSSCIQRSKTTADQMCLGIKKRQNKKEKKTSNKKKKMTKGKKIKDRH